MGFDILLSAPDVGELEQEYVLNAMKSGWVAPAGPDLELFESEMKQRLGIKYAVALSSGTAALHLALVSWGVGPGDFVPVSTMTFAATVNAIAYTGATPYLVDSEPESGNISPSLLGEALADLRKRGARVPAIIPVDLLGKCADYAAIQKIVQEHSDRYQPAKILSDAAESLGAFSGRTPAGAWGDAAVLSFNGNKIMTTSGGGMLLTNDKPLAGHVRKLSTQAREPVAHYEHTEIGYNYRLSNVLAALGRAQLSRLDKMIALRRTWRRRYRDEIATRFGLRILGDTDAQEDNCWLTALVIEDGFLAKPLHLQRHLAKNSIESRPLWKPMHLQPVYREYPHILDGTSDDLFARGLSLPSGSSMTEASFKTVTDKITWFLENTMRSERNPRTNAPEHRPPQ